MMSDYAHYGNPLKELELEDAPKKFKDETVRDEKGRRRFHGAFTGGFSAGYFNSVDTKEGWTPSQFISSRSNRANKSEQKAQDYMDNEDLGDLGFAPQRLQLKDDSRIAAEENQSSSRTAGFGSQRELLSTPLKRILRGDTDSVGVLILRGMGWRDGKGLGPKVCLKAGYGPQLPQHLADAEVGPDDIEFAEIKGTDKLWGLGYTPETRLDLFSEKIDRERVTQTTAKVGGRRLGIRGQAFGVGAFEDDDEDIYAKDDMTQYAFEEVDHGRHERNRTPQHQMIEAKKKQIGGLLDGFVMVELSACSPSSSANPIVVPPDWKPKIIAAGNENETHKSLSREQKVDSLFSNLPEGSVFNFLSEDARAKIEATKKAILNRKAKPTRAEDEETEVETFDTAEVIPKQPEIVKKLGVVDVTALRPFARDPNKQDRFERYIAFAEKGHREMLASIQPPQFSAWEAALEKKDFEAALLIVRPKLGLINRFESKPTDNPHSNLPTGLASASDITPKVTETNVEVSRGPPIRALEEFGAKTHTRYSWHPASVLCKRFNVPDPYPGQDFVGIPSSSLLLDCLQPEEDVGHSGKKETEDESSELAQKAFRSSSKTEVAEQSSSQVKGPHVENRIDPSLEATDEEKPPPSMDIFKMIFSDDEDEEKEAEGEENLKSKEQNIQKSFAEKPETSQSSDPAVSERKNTGIFANIDLSLLNRRPTSKSVASSSQQESFRVDEEPLAPMGPKPPPILAVETEIIQKLQGKKKKRKEKDKKRKKDSKSKKKSKKKSKSKKWKKDSSDTSDSEASEDDRKRKKVSKKKSRKRSKSSSESSSTSDESDERGIDERLRKKLKRLRSSP